MKKLLLIALSGFSSLLYAQNLKEKQVPQIVRDSFHKQYPNATAKWEKEKGNYEAMFTHEGKDMSVIINNSGTIIETEAEIAISALPATVAPYIKQHFKGEKIREAARITDAKGVVTYEAEIKGKDLVFDENGKFIREIKKDKGEKEDDDK